MTRAELRASDVAVVIDALRATSTIVEALAAGYERVLCVDRVERAAGLRGPGRVLAGERHCRPPAGFDQGNSPREARRRRGRELVLATTNGAPTIVKAASRASQVLIASLLNLDAVADTLLELSPASLEVQIVCSGSEGAIALEDVYVAGRLSAVLPGPRGDGARVAEAVARGAGDPLSAFEASLGACKLRAAGLAEDIADCARESVLDIVPCAAGAGPGLAASWIGAPAAAGRADRISA